MNPREMTKKQLEPLVGATITAVDRHHWAATTQERKRRAVVKTFERSSE
jgi:hypothetical protein